MMRDLATKADLEAGLKRVERRLTLILGGMLAFVVLMVVALR